ncbi:glycosyltransferase family 2 protein [Caballeronia sp. LZ029]|uniref:glycosyltransferase family 2 protein n=1 Tax=Caballeronia sp. LZ029 TaxID=3038564 RepID=UPI0004596C16|nr:glycosyltransferase family 2 protein [Caballeronia sp. LZ029]KAK47623.1 glycosyl transferase [Caballeronia jiangsuensis]MDR5743729.1 glycosyltransferase family 2 protein [Caballeronia sp. LZ029]
MNANASPITLSISIVVYRPDAALLARTIDTLESALAQLHDVAGRPCLYLIDNGNPGELADLPAPSDAEFDTVVLKGHGNVGYGRGHNLAIARANSRYHLILNPDVELNADGLRRALAFLRDSPETGLLAPWIGGDDGRQQFLCRRYPTVLDLFVRGFLPSALRKPFAGRLARYEMRDVIGETNIVWDPPIVSGCFMLFRTDVLESLGGFDPRYFLYFEDYDLSLRTRRVARIAYVPSVRILHHGGGAAKKGSVHIKLFVTSAYRFFNRFGWKWL